MSGRDDDPERWAERIAAQSDDDLPPLDPRLRWLAEGGLSDDERSALEAELAATPEGRAAFDALSPLGDDVFVEVVRRVHPRPRRALRFAAVALPLAAAALFVAGSPGALPAYQLEWRAGLASEQGSIPRGAPPAPDAGPRTFRPGDALELTLRPSVATAGGVQVLVRVDGRAVDAPVKVFPNTGTVQITGAVGASPWDLAEGTHEVTVDVGPPRALHVGATPFGRGWQRFATTLVVDPR